jgi:hypothetical protein
LESRNGQEISLPHVVDTGPKVLPDCYTMGTGGNSLGIKRPDRGTDHQTQTSAEVKKTWTCAVTLQKCSWRSALLVKHRDSFSIDCPPFHTIVYLEAPSV